MNPYTTSDNPCGKYFHLLNLIPYGRFHRRDIFRIACCLNKETEDVKAMIQEARALGYIIATETDKTGKTFCYTPANLDELCEHAAMVWNESSNANDRTTDYYFDILMSTIYDIYKAENNELTKHLFTD